MKYNMYKKNDKIFYSSIILNMFVITNNHAIQKKYTPIGNVEKYNIFDKEEG